MPPKVEYRLSDFGKSIKPILTAMYAWGTAYLKENGMEANCPMTARPEGIADSP
jgi:DNA-binding HxlR family transcriptional regulator